MEKLTLPTHNLPTEPFNLRGFLDRFEKRKSDDAFFETEMKILSREDYLEFRSMLKAWLRGLAAEQKSLRGMTRQSGGDGWAQMKLASGAAYVTRMIALRHAGKAWSSRKAAENRKEAA